MISYLNNLYLPTFICFTSRVYCMVIDDLIPFFSCSGSHVMFVVSVFVHVDGCHRSF